MSDEKTTDLIRELRSDAKIFEGRAIGSTLARAADVLTAQAAEIRRLKQILAAETDDANGWFMSLVSAQNEAHDALARATAAEAEAERLREALKSYACDCPKQCWDCKAAEGVDWVDKGWTARAALTERKP